MINEDVFPDLMVGKKIMYVHGFGSSAATNTVKVIQRLLPESTVVAEDIPLNPTEAIAMLREMCITEKPDLIIGTSMGGMYTEMLKGYDRILVNPAFQMGDTMSEHGMVGKLTFQNPRKDGVQEFIVTKALVKEYREMTTHCFEEITPEEQSRVWGMFGDKDPVVHTFDIFREHYPQAMHFHGEHRLTESIIHRYLIPLIRAVDDKQEGRERPVLYIHFDSMRDGYGKPKSSLQKAYDMLIENYDVYIVAEAPTNDHAFITDTQQWVEEYLSMPAWNKVVFTLRPSLLLGDYLITASPDSNFMGTCIEFGSDDFKTWEEVIVFFSRLNGQ